MVSFYDRKQPDQLITEPWIEWLHRLVSKPCLPWSLKGLRAEAGGRPTRHDAGEPGPSR